MRVAGIDPGSRHLGVTTGYRDGLVVRVLSARTVAVDAKNLSVACSDTMFSIVNDDIELVVIERAPFYVPPGLSYQAAAAMGEALAVMRELAALLEHECRRAAIEVKIVGRQTWAHRIVPHHRGGITDGDVRGSLHNYLDIDSIALLRSKHEVDAAGAMLWHLLPELARKHKRRDRRKDKSKDRPPRVKLTHVERLAARRALYAATVARVPPAEREAHGCLCGARTGRHRAACPLAPPPKIRGLTPESMARAEAAVAAMFGR